jgi:hypothetical protein
LQFKVNSITPAGAPDNTIDLAEYLTESGAQISVVATAEGYDDSDPAVLTYTTE